AYNRNSRRLPECRVLAQSHPLARRRSLPMKPAAIKPFVVLAVFALPVLVARAPAADREVKLGAKIDNLTFRDIRYVPGSLDDFPKAKAYVLVFTNTYCPLAQRYLPALKQLDKDYRDKGVQLLTVNAAEDDSVVAMAAHVVEHGIEFPVVKDFDGK